MRKLLSILLILSLVLSLVLGLTACGGGSDGGTCKYCGAHTNWTYRGGGYICYACDN